MQNLTKKENFSMKAKRFFFLSALALVAALGVTLFTVFADSWSTNFESFTLGSVNGQNGWSSTGPWDQGVVFNSYGYSSFGFQSFRISDAVTSGTFGNQTFTKSLANEAGETDATNGGYSGGVRQRHFEAQFDIASTTTAYQPGMHVSVSPDRGDGARMSYLRFDDLSDGIHVFFDDVTDPSHTTNADTFNETDIATINRTAPHTIKFVIDFVDGPDNDVVKIYIDGVLKITGTTWEDYFRFDTESNPSLEVHSRTVDSLLFREGGDPDPGNAGMGFLFDNFSLLSSSKATPNTADDCKNNGWQNRQRFDGTLFKNQGDCIQYVNTGK